MILSWDEDPNAVAQYLKDHPVDLRLILKTKNENELLPRWLAHHVAICQPHGLVIFDNASSDERVLSIYRELPDNILVVRYAGYMDHLHRPQRFPDLYEAIRASSAFYSLLDTDEFLYWFEADDSYTIGAELRERVVKADQMALPGIWLENVQGYPDRLWLASRHNHLKAGVRSGKPLLSTRFEATDMGNHSFQLPSSVLMDCQVGNLVVAHLKRLSPTQRVRTNLEKLRAYNFMGNTFTLADLLTIDLTTLPKGNALQFIREIQSLHALEDFAIDPSAPLTSGQIQLDNGRIIWGGEPERDEFHRYLADPAPFIREVFGG